MFIFAIETTLQRQMDILPFLLIITPVVTLILLTNFLSQRKQKRRIERQNEYTLFLQSDYWKQVRYVKLKEVGYKCQLCGKRNTTLHVHHNSYEHHGDELNHLDDLIVLCKRCHEGYHRYKHLF